MRAADVRRTGRPFVVAVFAVLGLCVALPSTAADSAAKKESELKRMQGRIEDVRKAIEADAQKRDALAGELKESEQEVQSARGRLADIRQQRRVIERELERLQQERRAAEQRVDAERAALAAELRMAYMNGRAEPLRMLLNQQDPARIGRLLSYYGYFGRARARQIAVIQEQLAHLELVAMRIAEENQRLAAIEDQQSRNARTLTDARARRAATLAAVEKKLKDRNARLAKLQADAKALEKLVQELRRAVRDFPVLAPQAFSKVRGKLPWPLNGELLARYGQPRSGGPLKWQGIVIRGSAGAQVRAPLAGRVVFADSFPNLGLLLVLDHGNGFMTLYGQNEQLYKQFGDQVASGDVLAAVADSGDGARQGLYFEIRSGKQTLNPLQWLRKR